MTSPLTRAVCAVALTGLLLVNATPARADVVLRWNEVAVRTLTSQTPALSPFVQARFAAIVQLAVFEAVNAITGDYQRYLGSATAPTGHPFPATPGASVEAAAIQAAFRVLFHYFGGNDATALALTADRNATLGLIPDGAAKTNGMAVGEAAALWLTTIRLGDGSSPATNVLPALGLDPGEWDMTPGCPTTPGGVPLGGILFNWGDVTPFGVPLPRPVTGTSRSGLSRRQRSRATGTPGITTK